MLLLAGHGLRPLYGLDTGEAASLSQSSSGRYGAVASGNMLEVMIEQWSNRDGSTDFLWSVWRDGQRVGMGGPVDNADAAEEAGRIYCHAELDSAPDAVTRL